jgi:hypothetical protein
MGPQAEPAMMTEDRPGQAVGEVERRIPDQRSVAEQPDAAGDVDPGKHGRARGGELIVGQKTHRDAEVGDHLAHVAISDLIARQEHASFQLRGDIGPMIAAAAAVL